jgi:hypothetical protein
MEGNLAGAGMVAALTFPASGGGNIGVMRLRQADKLMMVELIAMIDTPRGVELRFRHFTGALDALETTFKQTMLLKTHEATKDTFENLAEFDKALMSTQPRVSSWIRHGPDEMVAHSDIIGGDGKPAVIEVVYRRGRGHRLSSRAKLDLGRCGMKRPLRNSSQIRRFAPGDDIQRTFR